MMNEVASDRVILLGATDNYYIYRGRVTMRDENRSIFVSALASYRAMRRHNWRVTKESLNIYIGLNVDAEWHHFTSTLALMQLSSDASMQLLNNKKVIRHLFWYQHRYIAMKGPFDNCISIDVDIDVEWPFHYSSIVST